MHAIAVFTIVAAFFSQLDFTLDNVVPPLRDEDDPQSAGARPAGELPIVVEPFSVHVRSCPEGAPEFPPAAAVELNGVRWLGDDSGLYTETEDGRFRRYERYGVNGPLSSVVRALALDPAGRLWVGTPLGLSILSTEGEWSHIRGKDGLPVEDVTALGFDNRGRAWIGTTRGAVQYRPDAEGRKWFYRAGPRYLPNDHVLQVYVEPDGRRAWFKTEGGNVSAIDETTTTLLEKAQSIEKRVNERHRRLGLVAACVLDDAYNPTSHTIHDFDNDGLWTAYHAAAMSLCYGATGDPAAKESARQSMHALYMLQNASGTPGLVARSVVPLEEGRKKDAQWRPSPGGEFYWKSDTSSDEIDGHYFAFYTYWEHIARHDDAEREQCIAQVRALTDYIVKNNYRLIDWDGERTRWGFWNPENLNDDPTHYIECGLNSLQILSFLDTAWYMTGDQKYRRHFEHLVTEHDYLSNVLLEKKVFPDENNHSDNQLGYVAWYPILQVEKDPAVRDALRKAVRRHYKIVAPERPSFYAFVTATIDPDYVNLEDAVLNLKRIPEDRRDWRMENSRRDDVAFSPRRDRFGKRQLLRVLPADERDFEKWNENPYAPDSGGEGRTEDDGAAYLLPYWMGRFHGFIAEK